MFKRKKGPYESEKSQRINLDSALPEVTPLHESYNELIEGLEKIDSITHSTLKKITSDANLKQRKRSR
jgi:hypothetical protein